MASMERRLKKQLKMLYNAVFLQVFRGGAFRLDELIAAAALVCLAI